jgi:hypothetical protein
MDTFTRIPMLESGFNRGNGVLLEYEPIRGLDVAITFNSATPLSTTGGYLIAGKYSDGKFNRFYRLAGELILKNANRYPGDNTHLMFLTPSVSYRHELFEAHAGVQLFWANVDVNKTTDDTISGYNLRVGAKGRILDDMIQPFVNFSMLQHNSHNYESTDLEQLTRTWDGQDWKTMVITGGVDVNIWDRNGVGLQYSYIAAQQGDGTLIDGHQHFINLGATWWVTDTIAVGARLSYWMSEYDDRAYVGSEWVDKYQKEGERSIYLTARKVL